MKKAIRKLLKFVVVYIIFALIINPEAYGTDGYFSNGIGTKSKGMAGAGMSYVKGPFGAAMNPAGLAFLDNKWSVEVSVGLFNPNRKYSIIGAPTPMSNWGYYAPDGTFVNDPRFMAFGLAEGTIESDKKYFVIPAVAFSYKIGDKHNLGFNFYGNGGMNTTYETKTYYSQTIADLGDPLPIGPNPMTNVSQPTGVNLQQMFISLTYALQLGKHSIGLSPVFVYQTFEATGLEAFRDMGMAGNPQMPVDRSQYVTNNGVDNSTGFGVKIGYQGELFDGFRLGASFQPCIKMTKFDKYAGLFAEEGGFDIPANWQAGVSYTIAKKVTVLFDVKQILYSRVNSIANPMNPQEMMPQVPNTTSSYDPMDPSTYMVPNEQFVPLGDENGAGFGWEDVMVFKLGLEVAAVDSWQFRGGFSYGNTPVQESEVMFNILAPAVNTTHISLGLTKEIKDHNLNFAITHALNNKVSGQNPFDPAQTIELEMNQWEFELGFRF